MNKQFAIALLAAVGLGFGSVGYADEAPAEEKKELKTKIKLEGLSPFKAGKKIAKYARRYHPRPYSGYVESRMVLKDAQGKEDTLNLKIWALNSTKNAKKHAKKGKKKTIKKMKTFVQFGDNGAGLVTHTIRDKKRKKVQDAQYWWQPDSGKMWRINANNITGSVAGSELSIEDFRSQFPEKFKDKYIGIEECGKRLCYKFERRPKDKNSGYSKIISWLDSDHYRFMKTEYYDRKGALLKTSKNSGWGKIKKKYWRAKKTVIYNHQTKRTTTVYRDKIKLDLNLKDAHFSGPGKILKH